MGVFVMLIFFNGFLIPRESIPGYFIWIHYLSPFKYMFEALMLNEFDGLVLRPFGTPGLTYIDTRFSLSFSDPTAYKWLVLLVRTS